MAMQEAALYTYYPHIYWNAAVLSSDAGCDAEEDFQSLIEKGYKKVKLSKRTEEEQLRQEFLEEFEDELDPDEIESAFKEYLEDYRQDEDKKALTANRGKIAFAISNLQSQMNIEAPDINGSLYGFVPDMNSNSIICGLKVVTKLGNKLIGEIIKNRPYTSLQDFTNKVKISKDRVCYLIKAGAFRNIESRDMLTLLHDYVMSVSDLKTRLTLQNVQMLIKYGLLPDSLSEEIKLYNWVKYIRKSKDGTYYILDDRAYKYYCNKFNVDNSVNIGGKVCVSMATIDSYYKKEMEKIKSYINTNSEDLLNKLNNILFEQEWKKYGVKNEMDAEINSMRIHIHDNPFNHVNTQLHISTLEEVMQGETEGQFNIKGKIVPKMKIHYILGEVIDKDKLHNMISILTPQGSIEIKMAKEQFAFYNQAIVDVSSGEKEVIQPSFFDIGTKVLATGCIYGDLFRLKKYKNSLTDDVLLMVDITDDNQVMAYPKIDSAA